MGREQAWARLVVGQKTLYPVITGGIFEFGFSASLLLSLIHILISCRVQEYALDARGLRLQACLLYTSTPSNTRSTA